LAAKIQGLIRQVVERFDFTDLTTFT